MVDLVFGKYEIQHRLAIGGMGEVFYAVQKGVPGFERPVILKSLLPDLASQEGFIDQFLDEARVAATLNHPNVVSIYEVGLWNGTYFIAMEYIRGRNLAQLIRRAAEVQLKLPPLVAAMVIREAALGLDHAHRANDNQGNKLSIVHRDISPQNIMVRDDGVTKVVDFGIARASNRATRTATGALKGKLAYMAPEQILGKDLDARVDQFALGIVFWEMLTGRRLFKADSDILVAKKVLEESVPPPSQVDPAIPVELDTVVMKMMSRSVDDRYATCAEAAGAIEKVVAAMGAPSGESPVMVFMRRLGTEDLVVKVTPRTTSSEQNFVISLSRGNGPVQEGQVSTGSNTRRPGSIPPPVPVDATGHIKRGDVVIDIEDVGEKKRSKVPLIVAAIAVLGIGGGLAVTRPWEKPVEPVQRPPEVVRVEVVDAGPPVVVVEPGFDAGPPALPGRVKLVSVPPGAAVRFDGKPMGVTPQEITVEDTDRDHYAQFELRGYQQKDMTVRVGSGETKEVAVELVKYKVIPPPPPQGGGGPPPPQPPPTEPGFLTLDTTPWTKVTIDGDPYGSTPLFKKRLSAGKHTLLLENEEQAVKVTRSVEIKPGETQRQSWKLK